jgi:hypothetical protein
MRISITYFKLAAQSQAKKQRGILCELSLGSSVTKGLSLKESAYGKP